MYVIGIEGLVRAGKSTLVKWLAEFLNAGVVEEYGMYIKRTGTGFPSFPFVSYKAALSASMMFFDIEERRLADLKRIKDKGIILVDRTYLSCLGFDYAARYFTGFDTFREVENLWCAARKIELDLILFLDVSQTKLEERIASHQHLYLPHLCDPTFNRYITEFLQQRLGGDEHIVHINADQGQDVVRHQALTHIKRLQD